MANSAGHLSRWMDFSLEKVARGAVTFAMQPRVELYTSNGTVTSSAFCSVARMFTISPVNVQGDTSCFGLCDLRTSPTPDGRWDQVEMGQLIQTCNQIQGVRATCTIQFYSNGSWFGGLDYQQGGALSHAYFALTTVNASKNLQGITSSLEGINLSRNYADSSNISDPPPGTFNTLLPMPTPVPSATPRCMPGCPCYNGVVEAALKGGQGSLPNIICPKSKQG